METSFKETKSSEIASLKKTEQTLNPEVKKVLEMFESYGYVTHKGSNSFILANILVDYAERVNQEKTNLLSSRNYWETEDTNIVTILAFERYRIYNTRSTPDIFTDGKGNTIKGQKEYSLIIPNPGKIKEPVNLKVNYEELLTGSNIEGLNESGMDESGVYLEMDYVILPNIDGIAFLYPLSGFSEKLKNKKSAKITLYLREELNTHGLELIKSGYEVDADYLRFVTTELFAKFRILNRMSKANFLRFLNLRYKKPFKIEKSVIISSIKEPEILDFAKANVIPDMGESWTMEFAKTVKISISDSGLLDFLKDKEEIIHSSKLEETILYHVTTFYLGNYGVEWNRYMPEVNIPKIKSGWVLPKFVEA